MAGVASCSRPPASTTSPATAAYSDGFEVVVYELQAGKPANVRSLSLRAAESALAAGAQAGVGDPAALQMQLATSKSGDSTVALSVQPMANGEQQVRVEFHESNRTFVYIYAVAGNQVRPLSSEYHDMAKSKVVTYSAK